MAALAILTPVAVYFFLLVSFFSSLIAAFFTCDVSLTSVGTFASFFFVSLIRFLISAFFSAFWIIAAASMKIISTSSQEMSL